MQKTQKAIYEFHKKHKFPTNLIFKANKGLSKIIMWSLVKYTSCIAKIAYRYFRLNGSKNESFYRFHLMAEELAELMEAINKGDELKACDGLGDFIYVVMGTAVVYNWPVYEIIKEVCDSNSLKDKRNPISNPRLRNKGKNWRPPDIAKILPEGRQRLLREHQI